jgi:uncharacterized ferredoxin-like protein
VNDYEDTAVTAMICNEAMKNGKYQVLTRQYLGYTGELDEPTLRHFLQQQSPCSQQAPGILKIAIKTESTVIVMVRECGKNTCMQSLSKLINSENTFLNLRKWVARKPFI